MTFYIVTSMRIRQYDAGYWSQHSRYGHARAAAIQVGGQLYRCTYRTAAQSLQGRREEVWQRVFYRKPRKSQA